MFVTVCVQRLAGIVQSEMEDKRIISAMWAKDEDINRFLRSILHFINILLVWLTCQTPAIGGLIVCVCVSEYVCPKTCHHIARCMMNG